MLLELPGYAATATYPERYTVDILQRYCNEVRVCSLLCNRDVGVAMFVGAYSTEAHPFGLIYEYMDGLDLKQYLTNEPYVGKLKLVQFPFHAFPHQSSDTSWQQLADIAQDLDRMHDFGIVHGGLKTVSHISTSNSRAAYSLYHRPTFWLTKTALHTSLALGVRAFSPILQLG